MTRHLISRSQQLVVLLVLLVALATAVTSATLSISLTTVQLNQPSLMDAAPAPVQVADGWDDPIGG